ncbi:hypothetical protein [Candidatus Viridilinea mediisalina]|uniref:Uncharacterized protein n=1 Tax=Candidatus Viridilinea mediisalina TaxID=2024553 RepID=A0A2A6RJS4_9CHLR|nr:hypothetical protein [Candidatus Viridilinea mediisalina]PDW03110.1 hypothetical protein CJ255_10350 [Candidatus Viridilinea mediisalina]
MTQAEMRLIEQEWDALVDRLGVAEATRFVMLLDRRTGSALQHLRTISTMAHTGPRRVINSVQPFSQVEL